MTGSFGETKPVDSALQNGGMDVLVDFARGMLNFLINNTLELDSNSGKRRTIDTRYCTNLVQKFHDGTPEAIACPVDENIDNLTRHFKSYRRGFEKQRNLTLQSCKSSENQTFDLPVDYTPDNCPIACPAGRDWLSQTLFVGCSVSICIAVAFICQVIHALSFVRSMHAAPLKIACP